MHFTGDRFRVERIYRTFPIGIMHFTRTVFLCLVVIFVVSCGGDEAPIETTAHVVPVESLHPNIAKVYSDPNIGSRCSPALSCNETIRVDCAIEVDGPQIYYNGTTGQAIMYCGGACVDPDNRASGNCTCPPKQWACKP